MNEPIIFQVNEKGMALLLVNRPEARNALNWAAQEAFAAAVAQVAADERVRALVISGQGEQAFAAGGDLKELCCTPEPADGQRLNRLMGGALAQLGDLPLPVIAAVNGDAFGGGCELVTA
jgi:enoyl-CoA hydratase